ncbi:MAG: VOC family protein [Pseudomonadota bacterium]
MTTSQLMSVAPLFASRDFDRTCAFYAPFGFREVARYDQGYLILRSDGTELHFNLWATPIDPKTNMSAAYVRVLNMARFAASGAKLDLPSAGCPRYVAPEAKPWGMIEAHTVDPEGNLLIYGAADEGGRWDKREE